VYEVIDEVGVFGYDWFFEEEWVVGFEQWGDLLGVGECEVFVEVYCYVVVVV